MFELPPFLSEQWASAYFQVLFSILVFAVGIPFLGLQLVMQEDVRHVVTYRTWKMVVWGVFVVLLLISVISFIWVLHPGTPIKNLRDQKTAAANEGAGTSGGAPLQPPTGKGEAAASPTPGDEQDGSVDTKLEEFRDEYKDYLAGLMVTVIPIGAIAFAYWLPTNYTRRKIVRQFEEDVLEGIQRERPPKREALSKIAYLGEHGNPGLEKNLVLDAFSNIAREVQGDKSAYKGRELSEMIRNIQYILNNPEKPGNDENYQKAAKLLRTIWSEVSGKYSYRDATLAASILKQLGLTAVHSKSDETAHLYLQYAQECDDSVVFELGLAALKIERYRIAVDALRKLEDMVLDEITDRIETSDATNSLLGLLAHFVGSDGAAKRRADDFFLKAKGHFFPSLSGCLDKAIEYHYMAGNFATVNQLIELSKLVKSARAYT